jgi:hypothetical protein
MKTTFASLTLTLIITTIAVGETARYLALNPAS